MIRRRLREVNGKQQGSTLIELLVVLAITSILATTVAASYYRIVVGTGFSNKHMTVINNAQNAGVWISRDARMAETVNITAGLPTLTWHDYASVLYTVAYSLTGGELKRSYQVGAGAPTISSVADNISSISSTFNSNTKTLTLTVVATYGPVSENRTYEIALRNR